MTIACTLALDAMGGDHAPGIVIAGAERALLRYPRLRYVLFGDQQKLAPLMASKPRLAQSCEVHHTATVVGSDDKPSQALRRGRDSSMRRAIDSMSEGRTQAVVSAGNTGALMAMGKVVLGTLPEIDRPAIASTFPTELGETVVLDLGANVDNTAEELVQFALMGAEYAHAVLGRYRPTVGLLNVGIEEAKGRDNIKAAAEILRQAKHLPFDYYGFVEGNDITAGTVDVVVTDGFTGNIALKTAEGTARMMGSFLKSSLRRSVASKMGYVLARVALQAMRDQMDPRFFNGGVLLGLTGVVVKGHGSSDAVAFSSAIEVAAELVAGDVTGRIHANYSRFLDEARATEARQQTGMS